MQGWTIFDVPGQNIEISGNSCIAQTCTTPPLPNNSCQGISIFDGVCSNLKITNNVVIVPAYHGISMYGVQGCNIINNTVMGTVSSRRTWIATFLSKKGLPPPSNIVRNNAASNLSLKTAGTAADHNMTVSDPSTVFQAFDVSTCTYNLRPCVNSPLLGAGSTDLAPTIDIAGVSRSHQSQ